MNVCIKLRIAYFKHKIIEENRTKIKFFNNHYINFNIYWFNSLLNFVVYKIL